MEDTNIIPTEEAVAKVLGFSKPLPTALICDIDGTLATHEGIRGHYDWADLSKDALVPHVHRMLGVYYENLDFSIIYLTGRPEKTREATQKWLDDNGCPYGPLLMDPNEYQGPGKGPGTNEVKTALYRAHVEGKYHVEFALDDRDKNVKMWRDLGIPCLQVAEGAF